MSFRITHKTRGMRAARKVFRRLEKMGKDPDPLLDAIGGALVESAVHRLAVTNEGPDGTKWPQSRAAKKESRPTQYKSGQAGLAGSLTHNVLPGAVETGSALVYALQRQLGGTIKASPGKFLVFDGLDEDGSETKVFAKQVTQPARPYLGLSAEDEDEIEGLAADFWENILADAAAERGAP